jgi:ABC-type Fe3+-hydroxamate transport system substrate-binding protein
MRFSKLAAALAVLVLAACSSDSDIVSPPGEPLQVAARSSEVTLTNRSSEPLYYIAFEIETASLSLWDPCDDPVRCEKVAPGRTVTLKYSDFSGYRPGDDLGIVYYWRLRPDGPGRYKVDGEVESVRVPF